MNSAYFRRSNFFKKEREKRETYILTGKLAYQFSAVQNRMEHFHTNSKT